MRTILVHYIRISSSINKADVSRIVEVYRSDMNERCGDDVLNLIATCISPEYKGVDIEIKCINPVIIGGQDELESLISLYTSEVEQLYLELGKDGKVTI